MHHSGSHACQWRLSLLPKPHFPRPHSFARLLSADALDNTDYDDLRLASFDGSPPYPRLPDYTSILCDFDRFRDALHGHQLCQQREYEDKRLACYKRLPLTVFEEEVCYKFSLSNRASSSVLCITHS
jgi:hypothetical protein